MKYFEIAKGVLCKKRKLVNILSVNVIEKLLLDSKIGPLPLGGRQPTGTGESANAGEAFGKEPPGAGICITKWIHKGRGSRSQPG